MFINTISFLKNTLGLSFQIAKANFKVRNEGSYLGIFWYLLEPVSFFIIILLVMKHVSMGSIPNYPVYLFVGLIMYNFFNAITTNSTEAILRNSNILKSNKINPIVFVISNMLQFCFSHFFELIIFITLSYLLGINIVWFIFYPIILLFFIIFILGISLFISVFSIYVNDFKNVWAIFIRLLWFTTPVFYILPKTGLINFINEFNPLYYFIDIARSLIVFNKIPSAMFIFTTIAVSLISFVVGFYFFKKNIAKAIEKI